MGSLLNCCALPLFLLLTLGGLLFFLESDLNFLGEADAFVGRKAPILKNASVFVNGTVQSISLSDYRGKNLMLIFSSKDPVRSLSEVLQLQERLHELRKLNVHLILCLLNIDHSRAGQIGTEAHEYTEGSSGGKLTIRNVRIPLLIDIGYRISKVWGASEEPHHQIRSSGFIIDPSGIVRRRIVGDIPLKKLVDELLISPADDADDETD